MSDDFVQNAGRRLRRRSRSCDSATSDLLVVFGDAQLAGNVAVQLLSLPLSPIETYIVLTAPAASTPPVSGSLPARHCTPRC